MCSSDLGGTFYLKVTDASGFDTYHAFAYEEVPFDPQPQPLDTSSFATKEDLAKLNQSLSEVLSKLDSMGKQGSQQSGGRGRQNG